MPHENAPILTLRHTRAVTESEHEAMLDRWRELAFSKAHCRFCAHINRVFECGLWLLVMVTLGTIDRLRASDPVFAALFALAGFGLPLLYFASRWRGKQLQRQQEARNAGTEDTFTLGPDGVQRQHGGVTSGISLAAIAAMAQDADYLVAYAAPDYGLLLAKDAFAGQDVEAFCAELMHRWQAGCAAAKESVS